VYAGVLTSLLRTVLRVLSDRALPSGRRRTSRSSETGGRGSVEVRVHIVGCYYVKSAMSAAWR